MRGKWAVILGLCAIFALVFGFKMAGFVIDFLNPYGLRKSDWTIFQKNFISADGRVIDTGNGDVSHSEGQGYGLVIAAAYGDRAAFDRIWTWTQQNLQVRPTDKLLAWQWKPGAKPIEDENGTPLPGSDHSGAVTDTNNASDGDLLVAWALIRASKLWNDYKYQQAAAQILVDLAHLDLKEYDGKTILLPGTDGFWADDGATLNPSYYIFPALDEIAQALPGTPWSKVSADGKALVEKGAFGKWKLTPDWVFATGSELQISPKFPPDFGYNAVRVPLHIAWAEKHSQLLVPFADFWKPLLPEHMPATVNLKDDSFGPYPALPGMKAIAAYTIACASKGSLTVRALPAVTKDEPYFSASLSILTKIAVRESFATK